MLIGKELQALHTHPRFQPNLHVRSRTGERAFFVGHSEHIHTFTTRRLVVCLTRTEQSVKDRETVSVQAPPRYPTVGKQEWKERHYIPHAPGRSFPRNGNACLLLCRLKNGDAGHVCLCVCSVVICEKCVSLPVSRSSPDSLPFRVQLSCHFLNHFHDPHTFLHPTPPPHSASPHPLCGLPWVSLCLM